MTHAELTQQTPVDVVKRLFAQPPGPWPSGWGGLSNVQEAFRQMFTEARGNIPPAPAWAADRGIVICAGGWRFFASLFTTIRVIRHVGCTLPIQVWFLGDKGEFDRRMQQALADYNVGWIDANSFARERGLGRRILGGWELKPFAACYAPFREVISLDADSYPAYNPEQFMAHSEYRRVGASFWPDNQPLEKGQWERFGIPYHNEASWESGQFIVDKGRHWAPLRLTVWLNDHSDYVYQHVYGDKDTFHLAWRKCGHEVCVPTQRPGWHVVAFVQKDFAGNPLFIHRCRDKFRWNGEMDGAEVNNWFMTSQHHASNQFVPGLPHEREAHRFCRESSELLRPRAHFKFPSAGDDAGWKECNLLNHYRLPASLDGQTVVDIGANCGGFAWAALSRGAGKVECFEPNPKAAKALRANVARFGERAIVHEAAVFSSPGVVTICERHDKPGETVHGAVMGLMPDRTVPVAEVPAVSLDYIIEQYGPIDLLKLDCEGSEYAILSASLRLGEVGRIALEWHRAPHGGREQDASDLEAILGRHGFTVELGETIEGTHGMLYAHNPAWKAPERPAPAPIDNSPTACRHRGGALREVACELCSRKDQRETVFACPIHGECTVRRYRSGTSEKTCLTCAERE